MPGGITAGHHCSQWKCSAQPEDEQPKPAGAAQPPSLPPRAATTEFTRPDIAFAGLNPKHSVFSSSDQVSPNNFAILVLSLEETSAWVLPS